MLALFSAVGWDSGCRLRMRVCAGCDTCDALPAQCDQHLPCSGLGLWVSITVWCMFDSLAVAWPLPLTGSFHMCIGGAKQGRSWLDWCLCGTEQRAISDVFVSSLWVVMTFNRVYVQPAETAVHKACKCGFRISFCYWHILTGRVTAVAKLSSGMVQSTAQKYSMRMAKQAALVLVCQSGPFNC